MKKAIFFLMFVVMLNVAFAQINIESPTLVENEDTPIHVVITSTPFTGTMLLSFTNIQSTTNSYTFTDSNFNNGFYNYSFTLKGISVGNYQITATLLDSGNNVIATLLKQGSVISSMPKIVSSNPIGVVNKEITTISVRTNENAVCKFDTSDTNFDNMTTNFSNSNSLSHNHTLTLTQGEKTFYVRCKDQQGYVMNESYQLRFNLDLPPSADIKLSDESPVKAGTIQVELTTSESLDIVPQLTYQYNDNSAAKTISLTGSGTKWTGFIIILDSDDNKIGTFFFNAIDSSGNTGTKITKGNIFVVDTKKPNPPISIKATAESDGRIRLNWYYDGEEANYFKIYRSTTPLTNYVDFYANSDEKVNGTTQYLDWSTLDKVTYYYRVSTIDNSDNEGGLSEEVYATALRGSSSSSSQPISQPEVKRVLPPDLYPFVDDAIKKIQSLLIDIKQAEDQINSATGDERDILTEIKASNYITNSRSSLISQVEKLENMKDDYATEAELLQKIDEVNSEVRKVEKSTPKGAKIVEKSDFTQTISEEDIQKAVSKVFTDSILSAEEKEAYVKRSAKEKDDVKVEASVRAFEITYLDDSKTEKSWVKKKIIYNNQPMPDDVIIVESVPKTIAESANELNFGSQLAEVIDNDPIIKFGFAKFREDGETIFYSLDKRVNMEEMKNSRTVFLLSVNSFALSNGLTGNSIFDFKFNLGSMQTVLMWIGATLVLGMFGYYYVFVKDSGYAATKMKRAWSLKKMQDENNEESKDFIHQDTSEIMDEFSDHMKTVKADMADKLLPLLVALNQKVEKKNNSNEDYQMLLVNSLIDQAHGYIDNNLHEEAVKIYPRITQLYQKLNKDQKNEIFSRCTHLHRRIHAKKLMV